MKSKTIIMSSPAQKSQGRGILTIYEEDGLLQCRIRLYSTPDLSRFCKLGIYHQKEVFSANILEKNGTYTSSMVGDFNIEKDFYAAIVDTEHNNNVLLAGGTYAGYFFNDQSYVFSNISKENPNTNLYDYSDEDYNNFNHDTTIEKNESEIKEVCDESDCEKCRTCKYKEFFYSYNPQIEKDEKVNVESQTTTQNVEQKEIENEEIEISPKQDIISALLPQFDYVFKNYKADETLNNLIPNSKFVKIDENQEEYSIGAIYDNEKMRYICYAVLKDYNSPAPQELGKHYQWLPLDKEDPLSDGYYIVFQDASDLKIVEL